jgi:hypothetical protein
MVGVGVGVGLRLPAQFVWSPGEASLSTYQSISILAHTSAITLIKPSVNNSL